VQKTCFLYDWTKEKKISAWDVIAIQYWSWFVNSDDAVIVNAPLCVVVKILFKKI
jgi:hypothetical protein